MAITSDGATFSIAAEVEAGVTPLNPVWVICRITGESVSFAYDSTTSEELGGVGRGVKDNILTGGTVSGDINFELHKADWIESLMSAVLGSEWGNDPLTLPIGPDEVYVDSLQRTFSFEKKWVESSDQEDYYHWYKGLLMDGMTLTLTPNEPITGSFTVLGTELETGEDPKAGATYQDAGTNPVMTAPLVSGIEILDSNGMEVFDVDTHCFTNFVITLLNNARGLACIGTLGNREVVLGRFEGTLDYSIYFTDNTMLDLLVAQEELQVRVTCEDSDGNMYQFWFPRVKVSTAEVAAGGTGEDVLVEGQMVVLTGAAPNTFGLKIQRTPNTGTSASITPGIASGLGTTMATLPLSGGLEDAGQTWTITLTVTGGAPTFSDVVIPVGASATTAADLVAEAINAASPNFNATGVGPEIRVEVDGTNYVTIDTFSLAPAAVPVNITADAATGIGTTSANIVLNGGPQDTEQTATITCEVTSGALTLNPVTVTAGMTVDQLATAVASEITGAGNVNVTPTAGASDITVVVDGGTETSVVAFSIAIA